MIPSWFWNQWDHLLLESDGFIFRFVWNHWFMPRYPTLPHSWAILEQLHKDSTVCVVFVIERFLSVQLFFSYFLYGFSYVFSCEITPIGTSFFYWWVSANQNITTFSGKINPTGERARQNILKKHAVMKSNSPSARNWEHNHLQLWCDK